MQQTTTSCLLFNHLSCFIQFLMVMSMVLDSYSFFILLGVVLLVFLLFGLFSPSTPFAMRSSSLLQVQEKSFMDQLPKTPIRRSQRLALKSPAHTHQHANVNDNCIYEEAAPDTIRYRPPRPFEDTPRKRGRPQKNEHALNLGVPDARSDKDHLVNSSSIHQPLLFKVASQSSLFKVNKDDPRLPLHGTQFGETYIQQASKLREERLQALYELQQSQESSSNIRNKFKHWSSYPFQDIGRMITRKLGSSAPILSKALANFIFAIRIVLGIAALPFITIYYIYTRYYKETRHSVSMKKFQSKTVKSLWIKILLIGLLVFLLYKGLYYLKHKNELIYHHPKDDFISSDLNMPLEVDDNVLNLQSFHSIDPQKINPIRPDQENLANSPIFQNEESPSESAFIASIYNKFDIGSLRRNLQDLQIKLDVLNTTCSELQTSMTHIKLEESLLYSPLKEDVSYVKNTLLSQGLYITQLLTLLEGVGSDLDNFISKKVNDRLSEEKPFVEDLVTSKIKSLQQETTKVTDKKWQTMPKMTNLFDYAAYAKVVHFPYTSPTANLLFPSSLFDEYPYEPGFSLWSRFWSRLSTVAYHLSDALGGIGFSPSVVVNDNNDCGVNQFGEVEYSPGRCWIAEFSKPDRPIRLTIKPLHSSFVPTHVAIGHLKSHFNDSTISTTPYVSDARTSAPRTFEVYGSNDLAYGSAFVKLGSFYFDIHYTQSPSLEASGGPAILYKTTDAQKPSSNFQIFALDNPNMLVFKFYQIRILNNSGSPGYTSLYKLSLYSSL